MAPDPARTGPPWIKQAIETIRERIHALNENERELTIALLTGRDADVTPSPDTSHAGLPAQLQQHSAPVRPASLNVRRLCLADQPAIPAIPAMTIDSGT